MITHLEHPTETREVQFERGVRPVTLCGKVATSNPFVYTISIEDHIAPPKHLSFRLEQKSYRRCKLCLRKLAQGILHLDRETGATVLTKYPVPCVLDAAHATHIGPCAAYQEAK